MCERECQKHYGHSGARLVFPCFCANILATKHYFSFQTLHKSIDIIITTTCGWNTARQANFGCLQDSLTVGSLPHAQTRTVPGRLAIFLCMQLQIAHSSKTQARGQFCLMVSQCLIATLSACLPSHHLKDAPVPFRNSRINGKAQLHAWSRCLRSSSAARGKSLQTCATVSL